MGLFRSIRNWSLADTTTRYDAAAGPHLVLPDRLRFVRLVGARLGRCWRHHRPPHRSLHRLHWYLRFPRLVVEARRAVRTTTCERRPTRTNDTVTKWNRYHLSRG